MSSISRTIRFHDASTPLIRFFILGIIFYFLNCAGCSNSVDSPINSQLKDPRTYTWTLDTLYYIPSPDGFGQTTMLNIWGLNDTLVYVVGHEANYGIGSMWKFDGKRWIRVHLKDREGGTISKAIELKVIKGFAPNDIYAFGTSYTNFTGSDVLSNIGLHYDGFQWKEISMPPGQGIFSLVGTSPSMIYCGGWLDGQIYHYDGIKWSVDTIAATPYPDLLMNLNLIGISTAQEVYAQTEQLKTTKGAFFYQQIVKLKNNTSVVLDSAFNDPPWGGRTFWQSNRGNIYSCGTGGIFLLSGNKWKSFYSTEFIYSMAGPSEQHIFAVGISNVYFYDGTVWKAIIPYVGTNLEVHVWCSETQVFISYCDGARTYVLHGK